MKRKSGQAEGAGRWALGIAVMVGLAAPVFGQGSLTPPGAPGTTMKTLDQLNTAITGVSNRVVSVQTSVDQVNTAVAVVSNRVAEVKTAVGLVETRRPISSAPFTISQPGSYYLTTNLTSTGHGVVITASDVTLDLMGFRLRGDRGSSDYGVFLDGATNSAIRNVMVQNGIVRNFGGGIRAEYTQDSRFERLIVTTNFNYGIYLCGVSGQCDGNTIADCTFSGNGTSGIWLNGDLGQCNGNTLAGCTIIGNASSGIFIYGSDGQCNGNTLAGCTIIGNASYGVFCGSDGQCNGNTLANCMISGNSGHGIYLNGDFGQCNGNTIADCTVSDNGSYGVYLYGPSGQCDGNTIADCMVCGNESYGVFFDGYYGRCDGNTITGCMIRKNANRGIYMTYASGNRVEGNHITGQTGSPAYGIVSGTTTGNLIFRNTCAGQSDNFVLSANDTYGMIVTNKGALSGTDPWANFSR